MSENGIITIRTLECDVCDRYDSIMLSEEEVITRSKSTDMGIGAYSVVHKDHTRIIYFDKDGTYLGDTIAMNPDDVPDTIKDGPNKPTDEWFDTLPGKQLEDDIYGVDEDSKVVEKPRKRGKIITFFTQRFSTKR
ncbi:hypothetical protein LCGC14_0175690 [marine sediment metagenome]|uniref:Uncharacterized protein n=1 Tax=marine sediment metagenome TaxID=412755 RepID=A0A0F9URD3_9ZZZZ